MTPVEWGELYRVLSADESEPGPWRVSRVPWMREILECLDPAHPAIDVVFVKPVQVGATEGGVIWTGYCIDYEPGRFLHVQPIVDLAKRQSRTRYARLINETDCLKALVVPARSREGGNTLQWKDFPGGTLGIIGANSAAQLRSMPAPYAHLDEIDAFPLDVDGEGDPIELLDKRSETYQFRRKRLYTSTPLDMETSRIEPLYERSDQRVFLVPCPHCAAWQQLLWRHPETEDRLVVWEHNRPETARYLCQACTQPWTDVDKQRVVVEGRWQASRPWALPMPVGFRLTSLYSLWVRWSTLADEYIRAGNDPTKLKVFVNLRLAQTWKGAEVLRGDLEADRLLQRTEPYDVEVPAGVTYLTAGIDVQDDRLELEIVGWGAGEESWAIAYLVLPGDPSGPQLWEDVERVLRAPYTGGERAHHIQAACIDTGGHHTLSVYAFCNAQIARRVWAIKGAADQAAGIWPKRPSQNNKLKTPLYIVNTNAIKETIHERLAIEPPGPGSMHFPAGCDSDYFAQLLGQRLRKEYARGKLRKTWVDKRNVRHEVLDCRALAYAALHGLYAARFRLPKPEEVASRVVLEATAPQASPTAAPTTGQALAPPVGARSVVLPRRRVGRSRWMGR
jgi:phage terminase large subunit GpA-like protein